MNPAMSFEGTEEQILLYSDQHVMRCNSRSPGLLNVPPGRQPHLSLPLFQPPSQLWLESSLQGKHAYSYHLPPNLYFKSSSNILMSLGKKQQSISTLLTRELSLLKTLSHLQGFFFTGILLYLCCFHKDFALGYFFFWKLLPSIFFCLPNDQLINLFNPWRVNLLVGNFLELVSLLWVNSHHISAGHTF